MKWNDSSVNTCISFLIPAVKTMLPSKDDRIFWNIIITVVVVAIIVLIFIILVCKCHNTIELHEFQRGKHTTQIAVITTNQSQNVVLFSSKVKDQQHVNPSFIDDQKCCHHCLMKTDIPPSNSTYIWICNGRCCKVDL